MKKEVNGIELLQLIFNNRINKGENIYSKVLDRNFYWSGSSIKTENYCYLKEYNDIDFINDIFIVNIELSADELFKELGYIKTVENNNLVEYEGETSNIYINKKDKTYKKNFDTYITIEENKAINKKVEELGWLE
jgi:hypothetical protein